jgi:hypothetical protein
MNIRNKMALTCPNISSLPILRRGVVHPIKEFDQFPIAHNLRIELDLHRLCVLRLAAAHTFVVWIDRVRRADVPDACGEDALGRGEMLDENVLSAPEAAGGKDSNFGGGYADSSVRIRRTNWGAETHWTLRLSDGCEKKNTVLASSPLCIGAPEYKTYWISWCLSPGIYRVPGSRV